MATYPGDSLSPDHVKWMMEHASDDRAPGMIASSVITALFSTIFLLLRLLGRRLNYKSWHIQMSDWLLIVAWIFFIVAISCFATLTKYGGGRHIIFVTSRNETQLVSILCLAFYALAMGFLKLSILSLYGSIFPARKFRRYLWAVICFIICWTLTAFLGTVVQCIPVRVAWEESVAGTCIENGILQLVVTICNILTDFIILVMPIPEVRKLRVSAEKKRLLLLSFALGGGACLVSIVRLVFAMQIDTADSSWNSIPMGYVSATEVTVGFFVVSIPTYRPIYTYFTHRKAGQVTDSNSRSISQSRRIHQLGRNEGHSRDSLVNREMSNEEIGRNAASDIQLGYLVREAGG